MATSTSRSVVITGCSEGGIGDTLAQEFHRRGLVVFATARDLGKIEHLKAIGIRTLQLEVTNDESVKSAVHSVAQATGGRLDFLINNAGVGYGAPVIESDIEVARKMFDVNLFARAALTKAFLKPLVEAQGTVVNIGSIAAIYPGVWQGMYAASCAAQHMWSDVLRIELEPFGVKVVLIITGAIRTNFMDNKSGSRLKSDSMYLPAKEAIESYMDGTAVKENFVDVHGYAKQVADNVLKQHPKPRFWAGGVVALIWAASTFFWDTIWDTVLAKSTGISELRKRLANSPNI